MRLLAGCLGLWVLAAQSTQVNSTYVKRIERWRQEHEAELRAEDGWLTLTGLVWLKEGRNELDLGVFELRQGRVTYQGREMKPDVPGPADVLGSGSRRFHIIKRGERYGVRIRDVNHPGRREHPALEWFPVREAYRVQGRWVAHPAPRKIAIPNVLGETDQQDSPGYAVFRLGKMELRLAAVVDEGELFFIFRDLTAGKETYPAGRFVYAALPRDGVVELDFNKAYNPPCAVTPYATCPLPPAENRLGVRVEAGEKYRH